VLPLQQTPLGFHGVLHPDGLGGEHEDAGPDHHPHPEDGEIERTELLAQLVRRFLGVGYGLLDGLGTPQIRRSRRRRIAGAGLDAPPPAAALSHGRVTDRQGTA
jgi:hypothetical protein